MKIETKFDVGDHIWLIMNYGVAELEIEEIRIKIFGKKGLESYYSFKDYGGTKIPEEVFATYEEALAEAEQARRARV